MRSQSVSRLMLSVLLLFLAGRSSPVHGVPPAALAKSLGRVPVWGADDLAPASPVGAIVEVLL